MLSKRLIKGDKIGIISPSSPVSNDLLTQFNNGIKYLKDLGYHIEIGKFALSNSLGYSLTPEEKAKDINAMFENKSIKAIICSQGGCNSISSLKFINWEIIKQNPKIFIGISDITILLNAIYTKTGLITYHGNDIIWGFGRIPTEYDKDEFLNRFEKINNKIIQSNGVRKIIRKGKVKGKLIGGNIHGFLRLAGTQYYPDLKDSILFLEAFNISPQDCDGNLWQLRHIGVFDKIKGCIIGHNDGLQGKTKDEYQMENILKKITKDMNFPILKVDDFGHNCPNTVLPVGASISLDSDEKVIEIIEDYLY